MRKEYYDTYIVLYKEYIYEYEFRRRRIYPYDENYIIRIIQKSIDENDKENNLRPDAKYFLIVNFHHLIVRPLFEQRPHRDFPLENDFLGLDDDIKGDIATIISEAKQEAKEGEISGHEIMRTVDRIWKKLKTTRFEIWG